MDIWYLSIQMQFRQHNFPMVPFAGEFLKAQFVVIWLVVSILAAFKSLIVR